MKLEKETIVLLACEEHAFQFPRRHNFLLERVREED